MKKRVAALLILTLVKVFATEATAVDSSPNVVPLTIYFDAGEDVVKGLELLRLNEGKQRDLEETLQNQHNEIINFKETARQLNNKLLELNEKLNELNGKSTQSARSINESIEKRLLEIENKLKSINVIVPEQNPPERPTSIFEMFLRPAERACQETRREIQRTQPNATARSEFSYLVKIGKLAIGGFKLTCIGTLVDKRYVIAAAHCLEDSKPTIVQLGMMSGNISNTWDYTIMVNIKKIQLRPKYSNRYRNIIGLIELENDVNYSTLIYPICLYTGVPKPETGIRIPNPKRDGELHWMNILTLPDSLCFQKQKDEFVFCASIAKQIDTNCGSIKGPLIWTKNESLKEYRLIGFPAVYSNVCGLSFNATDITTLLDFIESIVWAT
ncbi:serine protease persephone isoform X2 [Ceratitis capitata]|uniref:serine protease persephone isoform X2 n=1 Tax=Ceratitis capitata TaxID=7213 RepID=UPI0006188516|nr:serine protease persephone isoform X2 [Ceratitis capitata]